MATKGTQTVKVSVLALQREVEAACVAAKGNHRKALGDYELALERWKNKERDLLIKALDRCDDGDFDSQRYREGLRSFLVAHEDSPVSPVDLSPEIERDIKLLTLSADATIAVTIDSKWSKYL